MINLIDKRDKELLNEYSKTSGLLKFNNIDTTQLDKQIEKIAIRLNLQKTLFDWI